MRGCITHLRRQRIVLRLRRNETGFTLSRSNGVTMRLLHIQSSPRGPRSHSLAATQAFLDGYREAHPGDAVETLDLWAAELPHFDGAALQAKYAVMGGIEHSADEARAWAGVRRVI